jgi:hypothetical protein
LIEKQMGVPLPPPNEPLPDDVEVQLSQLMAQAGGQVNQENQANAQQKKNEQMSQDPLVQLQQQELQLKQADQQRKQQKDQADAQLKSSQQQLENMSIQNKKQIDMARIQADAAKTQMQIQADAERERQRIMANAFRGGK